jgi:hypothetical protein
LKNTKKDAPERDEAEDENKGKKFGQSGNAFDMSGALHQKPDVRYLNDAATERE